MSYEDLRFTSNFALVCVLTNSPTRYQLYLNAVKMTGRNIKQGKKKILLRAPREEG